MLVKTETSRDKKTAAITITPQSSKIDKGSRIKLNRKFFVCEPQRKINLISTKFHLRFTQVLRDQSSPLHRCLGLDPERLHIYPTPGFDPVFWRAKVIYRRLAAPAQDSSVRGWMLMGYRGYERDAQKKRRE